MNTTDNIKQAVPTVSEMMVKDGGSDWLLQGVEAITITLMVSLLF